MSRYVKPREYDAAKDGNIYEWLVEEIERQRHWKNHEPERINRVHKPSFHSLNGRDSVNRFKPNKPGTNSPCENTFEITKARKL